MRILGYIVVLVALLWFLRKVCGPSKKTLREWLPELELESNRTSYQLFNVYDWEHRKMTKDEAKVLFDSGTQIETRRDEHPPLPF